MIVTQPFSLTASTTASNFSVSNGKIIHPNGTVFWGRGVNVNDWAASDAITDFTTGYPLLHTFPNLSYVRLNMGAYSDITTYASFISCLTKRGIVVLIDDHVNFPTPAFTGTRLTTAVNWFIGVATTYKNEPFVWFGTQNEPASGDIGPLISAHYTGIRGTGNNNIILGGYNLNAATASYFTNMTNVGFDTHFYAWLETHFGTNAVNALADELSGLTRTSLDGTMPYVIGEYGDATDGATVDADWVNVVNAVQQSGWGTIAWAWAGQSNVGDCLITGNAFGGNPNGALTSYGNMVATYIAAGTAPTRAGL